MYPSKAAADAGLGQADRNLQEAASMSLMDMASVQRREGEVLTSL
jgi:hypothetical protein